MQNLSTHAPVVVDIFDNFDPSDRGDKFIGPEQGVGAFVSGI
jgi:hypothetical protein